MTGPADSDVLTAALRYAARGWPVFPCNPDTKRPLVPTVKEQEAGWCLIAGERRALKKGEGGLHLATSDEATIRDWWTRWPKAMIGLPTGEGVGVVVVDLDPRIVPADAMLKSLARFCGPGAMPPCPLVRTQSGGLHLWFAYPASGDEGAASRREPNEKAEKIGNRAGLFAKAPAGLPALEETIREHVDIRGQGGYVIVPPSRMSSGKRYEWEQVPFELGEHPFPPLPARLLDAILRRGEFAALSKKPSRADDGSSRSGRSAPGALADNPQVQLYVARAMLDEARELKATPPGRRHDQLNLAAFKLGTLVGAGALSERVARSAIEDAAQWPGAQWTKKEDDTLDDGLRAGMASPRDLSEIAAKNMRASMRRQPKTNESRARASVSVGAPALSPSSPAPPIGDEGSENPPGEEVGETPDHDEGSGGRPPSDGGSGGGSGSGGDDEEAWRRHESNLLACLWLPLNDTGNAHRLRQHFGAELLHVREVGWHRWTDTHWDLDGGEEHGVRCAQRVAEFIAEEADFLSHSKHELDMLDAAAAAERILPEERSEAQKQLVAEAVGARLNLAKRKTGRRKFAVTCGNTTKVKGMIAQAVPHSTVAPEDLDADPMKFNVMNGTLVFLREREADEEAASDEVRFRVRIELRPHDRADFITKLAPVAYDKAATAPNWIAFLDRFQPDASVRRFLQVYIGYAMTGLTDEQVLIYNYGRGANGKSTFAEALLRLFGDYARNLNPEAVSGDGQRRGDQATPEIAQLPGARLVVVSELAAGQSIKENLVKALTGGERMQARHLNKGFFDFYPSFKAVMSGNDMPTVYGTDLGIRRRIKIVPWRETIADDERRKLADVLAEFAEERAGILNWLLDGLTIYLTEGLVVPDAVNSLTTGFFNEVDRLGTFIRDCVTMTGDEADMVQAKPFYEAFQAWCEAAAKKVLTMTAFGREMTSHGMVKKPINGRLFYIGIALHDVPQREASANDPPMAAYRDAFDRET